MKISYNWLKDYVDVSLSPEKLANLLTMCGLSVESVEKMGKDYILEIEVTAHRSDCLSVIGIARELAALTGKKLKVPSVKVKTKGAGSACRLPAGRQGKAGKEITVKVEDKKLCPRYTVRVIRNVKVGESPAWLKTRIEAMGLRSVNNIVDIINFCLFETGEPMHAFDLDKIANKEIIIKRAKKGEKITAIDGSEKILDDSNLVITDSSRPIALAGVIGGLNTEVTFSTKNILLEAAYFDPISIRRTARTLSISTESSYRFERKVDRENIVYASDRATSLIAEIAGGEIDELIYAGDKKIEKKIVELRYERLNKILGAEITPPRAKKILNSLGLKTKSSSIKRPNSKFLLLDMI